jgi:TPR repeat protein
MNRPSGASRRALLGGALLVCLGSAPSAIAQDTPAPASGLDEGLRAYSQRNFALAIRHWGPMAQRGDPAAQYNLGRLYARGEGVARDLPEAYKWFTLASMGGRREGEQARQAIVRAMTPVQQAEGLRRAEAWRRQQQR